MCWAVSLAGMNTGEYDTHVLGLYGAYTLMGKPFKKMYNYKWQYLLWGQWSRIWEFFTK